MKTNFDCGYATVVLLDTVKSDDGYTLEEGLVGVVVYQTANDEFIAEFPVDAPELVGGVRFTTALLNAEHFAITAVSEK